MIRTVLHNNKNGLLSILARATARSSDNGKASLSPSSSFFAPRRHFNSTEEAIDACRTIEKDPNEFFQKYVADDVMWTVTEPHGVSTPISKVYKSRDEFIKGAIEPLQEQFDGPLKLQMIDTVVQPRENTDLMKVCLELKGTATLKRDQSEWKNYYSWVMHFRKSQAVVVRAYLDSAAVNKAFGK